MIRIALEADTAAELHAAVRELAGIGTAPAAVAPFPPPTLESFTWSGPHAEPRANIRCLDNRYAQDQPDHLMVELGMGNMRAALLTTDKNILYLQNLTGRKSLLSFSETSKGRTYADTLKGSLPP